MANQGVTFLNIDYHELAYIIALVVLNFFMVWALRRISLRVDLREVISEKDPSAISARGAAVAAAAAANAQVQALVPANPGAPGLANPPQQPATPSIPEPIPTSYSRIAGMLGALVLVAAFWGLSNYVIWAAFWNPARLAPALDSVGEFFLAGSALFAPYAFNQLGTLFRGR